MSNVRIKSTKKNVQVNNIQSSLIMRFLLTIVTNPAILRAKFNVSKEMLVKMAH